MRMTREQRALIHKKTENSRILNGEPSSGELSEGVPVFRKTDEGLVQYVKHNNVLYKSILTLA
tara:strand:- start:283 stop:471 length:189 start_codon:yes stop_codon:yes gene_type:complete